MMRIHHTDQITSRKDVYDNSETSIVVLAFLISYFISERWFVDIVVILVAEIVNHSKLGHHVKAKSTGQPFLFVLRLLSNAHLRPRTRDSNMGTSISRTNA